MRAAMVETPETARAAVARLFARDLREGYHVAGCHRYDDAGGHELFRVARLRHPERGKIVRPMHRVYGRYCRGLPERSGTGWPVYVPPYPLVRTDPVIVCEGESDADALAARGFTARCSVGGAGNAHATDWATLPPGRVLVFGDHDDAGERYRHDVAAILRTLGRDVGLIDLAKLELPVHGDARDWLAAHPDATLSAVLALPVIGDNASGPALCAQRASPLVELVCAANVPPEPIHWLWPGWLARGKFHVIAGAPGTGKSTLALAMIATITRGGTWPDGTRAASGNVLLWSGEDDWADTLVPRLAAAGADLHRVHFVGRTRDDNVMRPFDPATDMDWLAQDAARLDDVALLLVDPVVSAVAGDSHKNAEVRRGLQPLVDLAATLHCAALGVSHFSKGTSGRDPVERVTGSLAFGALARLVMVTARQAAEDDRPERRVILRAKSNNGPDSGGFVYDLRQTELDGYSGVIASRVAWGEAVTGSARDLLAEAEERPDEGAHDAAGFLRELLRIGPRSAREVFAEANAAGFSKDAMHRAKRKIGALAVKQGMTLGWSWRLPEGGGYPPEGGEDREQNYSQPSQPSARPSGEIDTEEGWV